MRAFAIASKIRSANARHSASVIGAIGFGMARMARGVFVVIISSIARVERPSADHPTGATRATRCTRPGRW